MSEDEVKEKLCYYDIRNPNNISEDKHSNKECYCDNCFYGRTQLAEEILKYIELTKKANLPIKI